MSQQVAVEEKVFEYVIFTVPTEEERKEDKVAQIIIGPTPVVASSVDEVKTIAAFAIPEQYRTKLKQLNIVVRPF